MKHWNSKPKEQFFCSAERVPKFAKDPLEKQIEAKVCEYAKSKKILCYKFTSPNKRSVPDRILFLPDGRVVLIEFKRLNCKPTPAQYVEIDKLRVQKVLVFVVDSVEAGKKIIDELMMF